MAISTDITLLIGTRTGSYFIPDIISIHWTLKTAIIIRTAIPRSAQKFGNPLDLDTFDSAGRLVAGEDETGVTKL